MRPLVLGLVLCLLSSLAFADRMTKEQYIEKYKDIAIEQMKKNGVPASIIMAQALIESANGNGRLATEANNHFGIKCHKDWAGATIHHDDDAPQECFRKYDDVRQSFEDHSKYLLSNRRYAFLFELPTTDYRSWAYGLKKAGYATNPRYAEILIKEIEDDQLFLLDKGVDITFANKPAATTGNKKKRNGSKVSSDDNFVVDIYNRRNASECNGVKFVVAKDGDSVDKLADQYGLMRWQLNKYNDLTADSVIRSGQRIYIQPKRNKASKGNEFYTVKDGDTMYQIAQSYGMKLKALYKKNEMKPGDTLAVGQKIYLRSFKSGKNWLERLFSGS
nr:glucosaminidase domain-containing protein [uncultured Acetobacteroides sp.]